MIEVIGDSASSTLHLVFEAFVRSFSAAQVRKNLFEAPLAGNASVIVLVQPTSNAAIEMCRRLEKHKGRIVIFGELNATLARELGVVADKTVIDPSNFLSAPAPLNDNAQSQAVVSYSLHELTHRLPLRERPCCRFDFANEWNNLGFGRIEAHGPWGLSGFYQAPAENCIAKIFDVTYAGIWDRPEQSLLWWNREVGPIDSYEWSLIERFLTTYRPELSGLKPMFSEIPWGLTSAVTMRLDCDEDIQSAKPLFDFYRSQRVPFSLAIKTAIFEEHDAPFLRAILDDGGSILSHSHTHPDNWGPDLPSAAVEARLSKQILEATLKTQITAAVSPFHKNKDYSFAALAQCEYNAVVSGIIANDPEFLLARAGAAPLSYPTLITHSQQCMLHGDCVLNGQDPLLIYKRAFDIAASTHTLFGYLDHPFSPRYQYGWKTEEQRVNMHADFIQYMKSKGAVFLNENTALDFLLYKTQSNVWLNDAGTPCVDLGDERQHALAVDWIGQRTAATEWVQ